MYVIDIAEVDRFDEEIYGGFKIDCTTKEEVEAGITWLKESDQAMRWGVYYDNGNLALPDFWGNNYKRNYEY